MNNGYNIETPNNYQQTEKKGIFNTNITNYEVSKKIKTFSKTYFQVFEVIMIIIFIIGFFFVMEEGEDVVFPYLIGSGLATFLLICTAYIGFLFLTGYAAIIEDVNAIKEYIVKPEETTTKTKKIK